ncbi:MAG TPA: DUF3160 domain-containing protein [Gemmataceae bacterium]|nr:DUF3160 domain-containing protein [Gemmataceae bacterium]
MRKARTLAVALFGLTIVIAAAARLLWADPPTQQAKTSAPRKDKAPPDTFGYTAAFDAALAKIGQITPEEFARRYPNKAQYLDKLTWDPTTAKFWDDFNLDVNKPGAKVRIRGPHAHLFAQGQPGKIPVRDAKGMWDCRLNEAELEHFKRNGFVVSERLGSSSCTDLFYRIYERDLPVFISSDALLHAWHRSYDAMLEEIEVTYLTKALGDLLAGMSAHVIDARRQYGAGVLGDSLTDADYFLAVGRALLHGSSGGSVLDQDQRVNQTLNASANLQLQDFQLFGRNRKVDFSQFKPRGHYEKSEPLKRYFRAMMWCGRIDLRIAGGQEQFGSASSPRELGAAIVLHDLLMKSGQFKKWEHFDRMLQTFVGKTDSMTFAQLGGLLAEAGIKSPADVKSLDTLAAIQGQILAGKFGLQHIRGDHFKNSMTNPERIELPRSFTFVGQKFVIDSWATAKIVFDDIVWDELRVVRRIPSCLDVAFAALGNDQVVPELVGRMQDPAGRKFRDGLNYQHNLAAVREVVDMQTEKAWQENLYTNWLGCLRELSAPTTDTKYPEAMRTRAWAMKTLNTQLASWTQLRHDTVLYAKQSYTAEVTCFYPAGYVEPVPHFWAKLQQMAERGAALIEKAPYREYNLEGYQTAQANFLRNFAKNVATLRGIAEKQLAQKELSKEETKFLDEVVQVSFGCGGPRRYTGWYPGMFYANHRSDSERWDALVADVHTNVPSPVVGDPGCVLHQGVGSIDLMVIAIDNGKDKMVYAGPLLSHYEFEMKGVNRKSDSEWRADLNAFRTPPRPEWTRSYLVPGLNQAAARYKVD